MSVLFHANHDGSKYFFCVKWKVTLHNPSVVTTVFFEYFFGDLAFVFAEVDDFLSVVVVNDTSCVVGIVAICGEFGKMLPISNALNGGEDYELLFTIKQSDYEKIKNCNEVHIIGHITDPNIGTMMVTPQNTTIELRAQGWQKKED